MKSEFGFKLHSLIDKEYQFIRRFDTSTASVHDNQIDLSQKGETVYRDKGYFGSIPFASMDKTMKRSVRSHPISTRDKRKNGISVVSDLWSNDRSPSSNGCSVQVTYESLLIFGSM